MHVPGLRFFPWDESHGNGVSCAFSRHRTPRFALHSLHILRNRFPWLVRALTFTMQRSWPRRPRRPPELPQKAVRSVPRKLLKIESQISGIDRCGTALICDRYFTRRNDLFAIFSLSATQRLSPLAARDAGLVARSPVRALAIASARPVIFEVSRFVRAGFAFL